MVKYLTYSEIVDLLSYEFSLIVEDKKNKEVWIQEHNVRYDSLNSFSGAYIRYEQFCDMIRHQFLKTNSTKADFYNANSHLVGWNTTTLFREKFYGSESKRT